MAQRHITKIRCSKEYYQITQIRLSETKKKKKEEKNRLLLSKIRILHLHDPEKSVFRCGKKN